MSASTEYKTDAKLGAKAGIDQKTVWRIVQASPKKIAEAAKRRKKAAEKGKPLRDAVFHDPSVGNIDAIAKVFQLETWQLLVPGLQPNAAPVLAAQETAGA